MYKNFDLAQDFPNKILFHFLWVKMSPKKSRKVFRWPEICPLGKILAQEFEIAAVTEILGRRNKSIVQLLSTENFYTPKINVDSMYGGDCDSAITKAAAAVARVQSQSQEVGSGNERRLVVF